MRTGRSASAALLALAFWGCGQRPDAARERGLPEKAATYESQEAYSELRLDTATLVSYLRIDTVNDRFDTLIRAFYERRGMQYAWFQGDTLSSAAGNLLDLSGTPSADYGSWRMAHLELDSLVAALRDTLAHSVDKAYVELSLTAEFFRFADKRYGGSVSDLRSLDWFIPRAKKDYVRLLDSLVSGARDLASLEPVLPQYQRLKDWLRRYRALEKDSTWAPVFIDHARYAPGDSAPALAEVRELLRKWGDLADSSRSARFDSTLARGVRRFRERHGLRPVDLVDDAFIDVLNVPPSDRVRQVLVNMERLRWMPDRNTGRVLFVNIPAYKLYVYEEGSVAWSMDVVVGQEATRTVIFSDSLSQVVFAPYWNIPQSIIRNEILPAVKRSPGYLDRKNMEVVKGGQVVPSRSINWSRYTSGVPFTIRQRPGPGNALGQVKFLFPNAYSIYFHDTPAKAKFQQEQRAFSHGCIRLSEPLKLAGYLLQGDTAWTEATIKAAAQGSKERTVPLRPAVPVVIGYFTAWVDDAGVIHFRDDVYGHDARLEQELFAGTELSELR
ncbi:MAG: L,D-transpeptidase family protein [Flavobacteriales bacterium]|nr:L,D-transpeptidase family protein [Flavobacteriales bacterium]